MRDEDTPDGACGSGLESPAEIGAALLAWYDRHARQMPWRIGPADRALGERPDPYAVWLSEVMLQQTTVAAARGHYTRFMARWPRVEALAAADEAEVMAAWAGLGYYARARNLVACARQVVRDHGGRFPDTEKGLRRLPGIGPYTAAAVAAIAFDRPATVVDGNVERVMARLHAVTQPLPLAKTRLARLAARLTPDRRPGDHAQAMMDLGATVCTPRTPSCGRCPLRRFCRAHALGLAADLPRRAARAEKPVRLGHVFIGRRSDGAWLLERRPPRGLLGGMLGWPGSDWASSADEPPRPTPPAPGEWKPLKAEVRHSFTHFHLRLWVHVARLADETVPDRGFFIPAHAFSAADLPSAMRKAHDLARHQLDPENP